MHNKFPTLVAFQKKKGFKNVYVCKNKFISKMLKYRCARHVKILNRGCTLKPSRIDKQLED